MQPSVVPELAHTHTRPIHWVATATVLAGVVALSSLLQPDAATAVSTPDTRKQSVPADIAPPDPAAVEFPLDCGPVKTVVKKEASGDLDGDGRPETVAVVHCDAPMGTPPDGVYVLTRGADSSAPRVVATLVDPRDRTKADDLAVRDGDITATLLGYSSEDVPNCCPDMRDKVQWRWENGAFARTAPSGVKSV